MFFAPLTLPIHVLQRHVESVTLGMYMKIRNSNVCLNIYIEYSLDYC